MGDYYIRNRLVIREFKMLRIIAGISRRTISLSRPVLVAESDLIKAIQSHLTDALVEVTDTSDGCGSNFNIQVISDAFEGKRPVNRQRMVNKAIKEYTPDIHALRVTALTNNEAGKD